ncbi:MAG: hypothetical protein JXJ04_21495 [Spirochaetales bacterium]|nr:hypothetical protein [Spirochaetales bacterium]
MKKNVISILLLLLFSMSLPVHSLEIGGNFRIGNLAFSPERERTDTEFTGTDFYNWGLSLYGIHKINDKLTFSTGFYSDPILRNISSSYVIYTEDIFSIGIGPVFGFLNSGLDPLMKPGISAILRIEIPALIFFELSAGNSLNARLSVDRDYIQERSDLSIGFFVPNAICTANILTRKFTQLHTLTESGVDVFYDYVDSFTEYSFKANIFQKNVPYKLNILFAYQLLSKSYIQGTEKTDHRLNSIIIGSGLELDFSPAIHFTIDVQSSLYTFGDGELLGTINPGPMGYMFKASTGIKINIDKIIQSSKIE